MTAAPAPVPDLPPTLVPALPPFALDPDTAARTFPAGAELEARIAELTAALAGHRARDELYLPDEALLRLELTVLHLSRGHYGDAAGANAVAEVRADSHPARKKVDRAAKKQALHLSRLGLALGWQWHGRYVHSTMLYIELVSAIDDLDRPTQALTELCSATNDADQGLWDDAATHFGQAAVLASSVPVLPGLREVAVVGVRAARRQALGDAA